MGLPPPWEDEGFFLWPALSIAEANTLFTEHLNPEHPILFMLMGYSVVLGLLFKILPFSLEMGRWLSFAWMLTAGGLLAWMVRRLPLRSLAWGILAWAALSRPFVVAGNFVRPEAFCVLLVCVAMAIGPKRPWLALACLGFAPLMHPGGLFFVLAGIGAIVVIRPPNLWVFNRMAALAIGCLGVAWILMIIHVWRYLDFFIQDISYNLSAYPEPLANKVVRLLLDLNITPFFAICAGSLLYWRTRQPERAWMAALAAALFLPSASRTQMWYTIYTAVGQVVALCLLIAAIAEWKGEASSLRRALAIAAACVGLFLIYRDGALEGPRGYPRDMTWGWGMKTEDAAVPYLAETDSMTIIHALTPYLNPRQTIRVTFMPKSDALFFPNPATAGFVGYQPMTTSVPPDMVIYRESRYIPEWVRTYYTNILFKTASNRFGNMIYQRDQTERWTLYVLEKTEVPSKANEIPSNFPMGSEPSRP